MLFSFWLRNWKRSLERRAALNQIRGTRVPGCRFVPRPFLEALEDRTLLSTYVVTNTGDSGAGTLRQAIVDANTANTGTAANPDLIQFNIPIGDPGYNSTTGAFTIQPLSALPTITDSLVLDAASQPGYAGKPVIVLDGTYAGNGVNGLVLTASAAGSRVQGFVINHFIGNGVEVDGGGSNVIANNYIGTDASGTITEGNSGAGILVENGAASNTIGGSSSVNFSTGMLTGAGNLISGNGESGVLITGSGTSSNVVAGNFIGTDITGTRSISNVTRRTNNDAIDILAGASGNQIGGPSSVDAHGNLSGLGNLISGNNMSGPGYGTVGVYINGPTSTNNLVEGNFIGTDVTGEHSLANVDGVDIQNASDNTIGGTSPGTGNVISGNGVGIFLPGATSNLIEGNLIGTDASGEIALGNSTAGFASSYLPNEGGDGVYVYGSNGNTIGGTTSGAGNTIAFNGGDAVCVQYGSGNSILGNSIFSNAVQGIFLDSANNANNNPAAPVLTAGSASTSGTSVSGTLASVAKTTFRIEFFSNAGLDASGNAEGETYLGFTTVTTDSSGNATFTATNLAAIPPGQGYVTATATNQSTGDTSQFSNYLTAPTPSSLSGLVFEDFNDNGQVDFGEQGIAGVTITLTGTNDLGQAVSQTQVTDGDGAYVFLNLRPGNYYLTETQPSGYSQGIDTVGTAGGSLVATDQFFVTLGQGINGLNYNFGEQPPAGGTPQAGLTATIGFWNNKNGQALIKSFNGGQTSTQLGNWLAATLPHMFGANAGSNDLAGKSNAAIAALFQSDFLVKGVKLDAQVLATALSVYATNATLDNTGVAANYGFIVSGNDLGTATVNVGSNGAAFGVANNSVLTVLNLLKATDAQAIGGLLYNGDDTLRKEANNVYNAINEEGDI
jgi:hypothetical protein